MGNEDLIPALAAFAAIALLIGGLWLMLSSLAAGRRKRPGVDDASPETVLLATRLQEDQGGGLVRDFREMVERTGLDLSPAAAAMIIVLCGLLLAVVAFFIRPEMGLALQVPAFLFGAAIPLVFFIWRRRRYQRILQEQLPDALFLLSRTLRAGRPLEQAFQLVGDYGAPPLSREFARMHQQLELGLPLDRVTHGAAGRLGLVDFNVFASVVSLHRTTGGNLPVLLDRLAISTRDRVQFEGQYRATTVMGRYSAAFIGFLACVILVYFFAFQREWADRFFDTSVGFTGIYLFATAIGLELAGMLLLFWLLRYDY